jgi:hypothetical protein
LLWIRSFDTTLLINASPARHHAIIKTLAALEASTESTLAELEAVALELDILFPPKEKPVPVFATRARFRLNIHAAARMESKTLGRAAVLQV